MRKQPRLNPENLVVHQSVESLRKAVAAEPEGRFLLELVYDSELRAAGPQALANEPALANVGALTIDTGGLEPKQLKMLLTSPHFQRLTVLDLSHNFFHDTGAKLLAAWAPLSKITHLAMSQVGLTSKGLAAVAASPHLGALRFIDVSRNNIKSGAGVSALGAVAAQLERWSLWGNDLGDAGVKAVASSPLMRGKAVNLCRTMMTKAGLKALLASPDLSTLEELDISSNHDIGDAGIALIAKAKSLGALRSLDLRGTGMSDTGAMALAASPALAELTVLRVLRSGALTEAGIEALQSSSHLAAAAKRTLEMAELAAPS
ncbi:MAG: hypothetical protein Q8N23_33925 [Archangium sp.]|nr:hypothetical protein [Archangium sp.]MDP3575237.1 hypothetical protein [Archangium sp.]